MNEQTTAPARHFPHELAEQPEALERTDAHLATALAGPVGECLRGVTRVIWVGSGDCYFVGSAIASLMERIAGVPAGWVEAYDFVRATPAIDAGTLVVGFSSSGKSVYTVEAVELARAAGARTIAVTNTEGSRLEEAAEHAVSTQAGRSFSFPTKTTTAALLTGLRMAELLARHRGRPVDGVPGTDRIVAAVRAALGVAAATPSVAGGISAARRVVVVGSGLARTAALIGAAKLIETCEIAASANNCEEFLHLVGFSVREVDAVIVIDDGVLRSRLAAQYAVEQGACTVIVTATPDAAELPAGARVLRSAGEDDITALFADIVVLHQLAADVSANRGTNPDIPSGVDLDYVIGLLYTDPVDGWNTEAARGLVPVE